MTVVDQSGRGEQAGGSEGGDWATDAFEASRPRLRAVAYRMLGSASDADDVVQEAWLRLHRADPGAIGNFQGWLTTVVARICLDALRARRSRPDTSAGHDTLDEAVPVEASMVAAEPDHDVLVADAIGPALMVVLDRLGPAERLAFVLHDLFAVPFGEIAPIVGRSPQATRQLASRARRRVRGDAAAGAETAGTRGRPARSEARAPEGAVRESQRRVVDAFLAAARVGDFEALLAVLDPAVVVRADEAAVELAIRQGRRASARGKGQAGPRLVAELHGAEAAARTFYRWAGGAQPALVDGEPGAVWAPGGRARSVFAIQVRDDRIVAIEIVADPARIGGMDLAFGAED